MKGNVAESLSDQLQRLGSKEDWYAKGGMVNTKYKRGDQVVATRTIPGKVQRGDAHRPPPRGDLERVCGVHGEEPHARSKGRCETGRGRHREAVSRVAANLSGVEAGGSQSTTMVDGNPASRGKGESVVGMSQRGVSWLRCLVVRTKGEIAP